jgi:hypothetical protein
MQAVSNGASVLSFVIVAIQGVQKLCTAVSAIKEAPKQRNALLETLRALESVLTDLKGRRVLRDPNVDIGPLRALVNTCSKDVGASLQELVRPQRNTNSTIFQEAFRWATQVAKVGTWEALLNAIRTKIVHHCGILQVQLGLIQS